MSETATSEIAKEIGDSWYAFKVDGTKDPTGCENVSIMVRYEDINNETHERLLVMASTKHCNTQNLTNLYLSDQRKA